MTYAEIRELTMGVYQIKQAKPYTTEHKKDDQGFYRLQVHKNASNIMRVKLQSRHTTSKVYNLWIEYNAGGIRSWHCQCEVGARTVGCCVYIASVI